MASGVILARILSKEDLATYLQTFLAYNFAAPLLTLALPSALYFFLPRKVGEERTVLAGNLLLLLGMGFVFTMFLLLGGAKLLAWRFHNPALEHTLLILAPYPLFVLPAGAVEACLVARDRVTALTIFSVCSRLVLGVAIITSCLWFNRPEVLVLVQVGLTGLLLVPSLWLMFRACPGKLHRPSRDLLWAMVKYSVPLGFATVLGSLSLQLSSVVVSAMCSPAEFAVYSVGAFELPLVGIVTGSITTVILADMARLCHEGRKDEALSLFRTAAVRSAAILLPAMVFFLIMADPFIEGLYSNKYQGSIAPFRLYLLILPMRIVTYGAALMALGLTRVVLFRSVIDLLLNAALCTVFVWLWGYLGAVIALVLTLYVWSVPYNLHTIAKGFGVPILKVLPFPMLSKILLVSAALVPLPLVCLLAASVPKLVQFCLAALLYWPPLIYLFNRFDFIPAASLLQRISKRAVALCSRSVVP
jgi:O-antigen/teichoic acid export membrane protein